MNNLAVLPTPSNVFRALLTATGYRPLLKGKGSGSLITYSHRPCYATLPVNCCQPLWGIFIRAPKEFLDGLKAADPRPAPGFFR